MNNALQRDPEAAQPPLTRDQILLDGLDLEPEAVAAARADHARELCRQTLGIFDGRFSIFDGPTPGEASSSAADDVSFPSRVSRKTHVFRHGALAANHVPQNLPTRALKP